MCLRWAQHGLQPWQRLCLACPTEPCRFLTRFMRQYRARSPRCNNNRPLCRPPDRGGGLLLIMIFYFGGLWFLLSSGFLGALTVHPNNQPHYLEHPSGRGDNPFFFGEEGEGRVEGPHTQHESRKGSDISPLGGAGVGAALYDGRVGWSHRAGCSVSLVPTGDDAMGLFSFPHAYPSSFFFFFFGRHCFIAFAWPFLVSTLFS